MRRIFPIIAALVFVGLACEAPRVEGLQETFDVMKGTIGAGLLTELPGTIDVPFSTPHIPKKSTPDFQGDSTPGIPKKSTPDFGEPGKIRGQLSYPSEFLPAQRIVAFDVATMAFVADVTTSEGDGKYELVVPAGDYYIVAYLADGTFSAGYSQAVPCGLLYTCTDHSLIPVHVDPGAVVTGINPQDWYAPPGSFPAMP